MVVAAAALAAYLHMQGGWKLILLLLLVPDLSFAAYLAGPRVGAIGYNIAHTYAVPGVLLAGAMLSGWAANVVLVHIALIHIIHIGLDRALGYGLKSPAGFQETHLGRIGRRQ